MMVSRMTARMRERGVGIGCVKGGKQNWDKGNGDRGITDA